MASKRGLRDFGVLADHLVRRAQRRGGKAFFITGTDTGVGKTQVTCNLLRELRRRGIRAAGLKAIACGGREDAVQFARFSAGDFSVADLNPIHLPKPVAPLAQPCPRWPVLVRRIRAALKRLHAAGVEIVLVEGAGGLLCPIDRRHTMRELARALQLSMVIVARDRLGVLNQVLLTVEATENSGLRCAAIVLDRFGKKKDFSRTTNAKMLRALTRKPIFTMS